MVQANHPLVVKFHDRLNNVSKRDRDVMGIKNYVRLEIPLSHPRDFAYLADKLRGLASFMEQEHLRTERADGMTRSAAEHLRQVKWEVQNITRQMKAHCKDYDID